MFRFLKHPGVRLLAWVPPLVVFDRHFYSLKIVTGNSMQPTLNPEPSLVTDLVLLDRLSVAAHKYSRRDVVTLWSPLDHKLLITKRIIALEGDTVHTLPPYPDAVVTVPPGHAWVEGDEPFHSRDSNNFGPVPLGLINAKVVWIVWPIGRWGPLATPSRVTAAMPQGITARVHASSRSGWRRQHAEVLRMKEQMKRVELGPGR